MEQFLRIQEQLGAQLQIQIKTLSESRDEYKTMCEKRSDELRHMEETLKVQQSQTEKTDKLFREAEAQLVSAERHKAELENVVQDLKKDVEVKMSIHYI